MPKTVYSANNYINSQYRGVGFSVPSTIYVGVFTTMPTPSTSGTEVATGAYVRQTVTFSAPASGVSSNSADVQYPIATLDWGTILGYGYFDALSNGNLLSFAPLGASRVILTGDRLVFPATFLTITES